MIGMDGVFHLYPPDPSIEGKMADQVFSGQNLQVVYDLIDLVGQKKSGFLEYNWHISGGDQDKLYKKELERINKYLHQQANTDALTGLYNRQYFNERLGQEILRAERYKRSLSLMLLDIDFFKQINDNFGHLAGDGVFRELAVLMQSQIRNGLWPLQIDALARAGKRTRNL